MEPVTQEQPSVGWRERIRQSRFGTPIVLVVTAIVVMTAAFLINKPQDGDDGLTSVHLTGVSTGEPPVVGHKAQDFVVKDVNGRQVSLEAYRGHPIWLTFGASWCAACRAEAVDIQGAYAGAAKQTGLVVISVFISENSAEVKTYGQRIGLTSVQVSDPDTTIASAYRVLGIPVHFFIDRTGVIRLINTGTMSRERMDAAIAELSADGKS